MRKTGRKWKTKKCSRCGESHEGYSGKLDKNGIEYVVCGATNKRMNINGEGKEGNSFAFPTIWEDNHNGEYRLKKCIECESEKKLSDYANRKDSKDGHANKCKKCQKQYHSKWYQDNKEHLKRLRRKRKKEIQEWFRNLKKGLICEKCNEKRWYVLEFHHKKPKEKEYCISILPYKAWGKERILKEIKKCSILCANCHKELHYFERKGEVTQ